MTSANMSAAYMYTQMHTRLVLSWISKQNEPLSDCYVDPYQTEKRSNTTISEPSSACQLNATSMSFHWSAYDGPTLNAGFAAL